MTRFTMGAGCFWCLEAALRQLDGITTLTCGYSGGHTSQPDYDSVCSGSTGHIEVVQVDFNAEKIEETSLLDFFFACHDPTSWDKQGADQGSQYRSVLFYEDKEQEELFIRAKQRAQQLWPQPIVTVIQALRDFWPAEEYHQNYYAKNPNQGYCQLVINPKLAQLRKKFARHCLEGSPSVTKGYTDF
ncbi:MAG: peptide-methionine (S)-S-oxide reductase MsrA [Rothia sp. (in: high G+C Gram-positive bacteria)]|nr:peptide-methionine (S)-S-oxide reductase MsrA [Rothia sp. (in: high G+C Gram-positive bacteria)]